MALLTLTAPRLRLSPVALALVAVAGFGAVLAIAPLASLVHIALTGDAEIWPHLARYVLPTALKETALLLGAVGLITVTVGAGTAWLVTTFTFPGRGLATLMLPLPLAIPTYIVAYVYVDVLDALGPVQSLLRAVTGWRSAADYWFPDVRSLSGAAFVMGFVLYPYVHLAARAMFQAQSATLTDAARTLGASRWRLTRDVTLPLARPALAVGLALALLETLNDIGASEYLGVRTLTIAVFNTWLNRSSLPGAAQIACVMLIVVAGLIALERYGRRQRRFGDPAQGQRRAARVPLGGVPGALAALACFLPVTLGFVVPLGYLIHETVARGLLVGFDPELIRHATVTVLLAAAATLCTLVIGCGAALAVRVVRRRFVSAAFMLATLGYAVPGTVLALGLLSPLVAIDDAINVLARLVAGADVGLIVAGSGAALVIAYTTRFLAIAAGFAQAGLARVSTEFDDSARSMGAPTGEVIREIHWPLARPALWGAALLVFVDCLKELPATLLLRPLNVETLSTYIYQFATRGNFEEGSLAALLIVLAGIGPVIFMLRHADAAFAAAKATRT